MSNSYSFSCPRMECPIPPPLVPWALRWRPLLELGRSPQPRGPFSSSCYPKWSRNSIRHHPSPFQVPALVVQVRALLRLSYLSSSWWWWLQPCPSHRPSRLSFPRQLARAQVRAQAEGEAVVRRAWAPPYFSCSSSFCWLLQQACPIHPTNPGSSRAQRELLSPPRPRRRLQQPQHLPVLSLYAQPLPRPLSFCVRPLPRRLSLSLPPLLSFSSPTSSSDPY